MNALRRKYKDLCEIEARINLELDKAIVQNTKPSEEVLRWLQDVVNLQNQVDSIERSARENRISCIRSPKLSGLVKEATKAVDRLVGQSNFADGLVVIDDAPEVTALRREHIDLYGIETRIMLELGKARLQYMKPTEEVLRWLQDVENIQKQVVSIERSAKQNPELSGLVKEATKEIDRLVRQNSFADGLVVIDEAQFPPSALVGTSAQEKLRKIWVNLMDPRLGIIGIHGAGGVGKTTIMTTIMDLLVTSSVFDKVLWVPVSKEWRSRGSEWYFYGEIQKEIALQLNLDLGMSEYLSSESIVHQAAELLESRLNKIKKFVIIFDDVWDLFSLETVGIPQLSEEDGRKIVLISRSTEVFLEMKSYKLIEVDVLHPDEAWDLFVSEAGDIVCTPDIHPLAKRVVTKCRGVPIFIVSVGQALRDEVSIEAWEQASVELSAQDPWNPALVHLRFSYNRLRTDHAAGILREYSMDRLRSKYEDLCKIEGAIWMEVTNAREQYKKPREGVLSWLNNVEDFQELVESIEISAAEEVISSGLVEEAAEAIDQLLADGLVVLDEAQFQPSALVGTSAQENLDKIWVNLMDTKVGIIGITGTGGVGKTTIMTRVMNLLVASSMFDKVLWVTVSNEWSYDKIQNEIASQLNLDLRMSEYQSSESIAHQPAKLLESRLNKIKKFVIIFDDIWPWDPFSLEMVGIPQPSGENERKIVLISRSTEVCLEMKSDKLIEVDLLHPDEAWDLFVSKAGNIVYNPGILKLAKRVVTNCRRLPIVIVSVGLALRNELSIEAWREASKELNTQYGASFIEFNLLKFSYNRLRTDTMKNCFLYCALFPEDYLFKPDELIRYWMAEGFIHKDGDMVTEIDDGFKILKALVDANMLEMLTKNGDERVKMHDLIRGMAIYVMGRDKSNVWHRPERGLFNLSSGIELFATKISMTSYHLEGLDIIPINCPNLSTLLLRDNPISHITPLFFTKMLALDFLDISYSRIRELPSSLFELARLRVLFLQHCTSLEKMPSLEKMKNLQVLSLCGTSIAELPQGMERLTSLRSLDLSETTKLVNVRAGVISSLTRLEELRMQGCGLCRMDTLMVENFLKEMRCLNRLAILTISSASYADLLDTILCLQEQSLKIFSVNVYGSTEDYNEDEETM